MSREKSLSFGVGAALLTALVFLPVIGFSFLSADDPAHVATNPILRGSLSKLWSSPYQVPGLYMPTTYSVWWATAKASLSRFDELSPAWFHSLNWFFHSLNVLLAFLCFQRVGFGRIGAAAAALVFGLHPIQVESVAWITAFKDVFAGTFVLLCTWLALGEKWRAASFVFLLALLAKPVAAVTPILVAAFLWAAGKSPRPRLAYLVSWLVLSAGMLAWTKALQPGPSPAWLDRIVVAGDSLTFSIAKALMPVGLTLDYGRSPASVLSESPVKIFLALLLLVGFVWRYRSHRIAMAGVVLFLTPWLPVSGAVSFFHQIHSTTADRFLYLSLLGLALVVGHLLRNSKSAAAVLVGIIALLTTIQIPNWRNDVSLYSRMADVRPTSENFYRLGMAQVRAGQSNDAILSLSEANKLNPKDPRFSNNLALLHAEQGRFQEAENELRHALELSPDSLTLRNNLETLVRRRISKSP